MRNYTPIVRSFLYNMQLGGWKINAVHDGEHAYVIEGTHVKERDAALGHIMAVDESSVILTKLVDTGRTSNLHTGTVHNHLRIGALIVLGNDADELVADWSFNNEQADQEFRKAYDKFTARWEGKDVPTAEEVNEVIRDNGTDASEMVQDLVDQEMSPDNLNDRLLQSRDYDSQMFKQWAEWEGKTE